MFLKFKQAIIRWLMKKKKRGLLYFLQRAHCGFSPAWYGKKIDGSINSLVCVTLEDIQKQIDCIIDGEERPIAITYMPAKTGNHTLDKSVRACNSIPYVKMLHEADFSKFPGLQLNSRREVRLVTAVREPIGHNLSLMFHVLAIYAWAKKEYWESIGDKCNVNLMFHDFLHETVPFSRQYKDTPLAEFPPIGGLIQNYFDKGRPFERNTHIDLYQYPFDKEKGYTVFTQGNFKVFVYQLEKLNQLEAELGEFLQIPEFKIIPDHVGEAKDYGELYKQAKKGLKFSREYYDACFESRYIRHFYSEADIEKFKKKWKGHIRQ